MTPINLNNGIHKERRAGVLLHPTSLPGYSDNGDIGHQAYRFIEFLQSAGLRVWQMLPLGATHDDKSPYQCLSAHAGNPLLISLDWLEDRGWLDKSAIKLSHNDDGFRKSCLKQAARKFYQLNDKQWLSKLKRYREKHSSWIDDYALFVALKKEYENKPWYEWPTEARHRDDSVLDEVRVKQSDNIHQTIFEQFVFFTQWTEIRKYAASHNVELFGDMPIFVARDSADVWAQKENFLIDQDGNMKFIAGVPPDAFSDTGQRWGNPLYDWDYMLGSKFSWWKERFRTQLELFDILRVDHFRGLQACWYIPEDDDTAINGEWVKVPGQELLTELFNTFDYLPLVAEDLGVITDEVIALKDEFKLPGMKVLQFAFDGNNSNPHLPHQHHPGDLVYTGTHDNDTTLGWIMNKNNYSEEYFLQYTASEHTKSEQGVMEMIRLAMSSVSFLCIIPMQDLMLLDSSARMNVPGTSEGNWLWRFEWDQLNKNVVEVITNFTKLYQR